MYAENGKIASRQTFRLYVFDLMGIATLLIPPYLAKLCGADGIIAILLGSAAGFVYLLYLGWIMKKMKMDICSYLDAYIHPSIKNVTYGWILTHCILTAGFCAYIFANLMRYSLIREMSYHTILFVILIGAAYAVSGGLETRARIYEVLFWFVLIPYTAMMAASVRNFKMMYIGDFFHTDSVTLLKGMYLVFLLLTPLFFSLFLIGEKEKNYGKNMVKTVAGALLVSAFILLGSYVLLIGNFGDKALATMRYPVVTLMSTIQFKGNFLKRMDALMLAVWFFTLYALLNLHLHYGVKMIKQLTSISSRKSWWQLCLPVAAVYAVAWFMESFSKGRDWFLDYYSYVAVPMMIVVPGVLLLCKKEEKG